LCMMARGVKQQHVKVRTSSMLGLFREEASARAEVIDLLRDSV
jgi:GTP cyclohydrolase I